MGNKSSLGFKKPNTRKVQAVVEEEKLITTDRKYQVEEEVDPTTPKQEPTFKYAEVWQRAKNKIVMNLRLKRLMGEIKKFGPNSTINLELYEGNNQLDNYFTQKAMRMVSMRKSNLDSEKVPSSMSHPEKGLKVYWNVCVGVILLYTAIVTPFVISFLETSRWDFWFWLDLIIDLGFMTDVAWNLNTAYYDKDGVLETRRKKIFLNYLKGWLVVDFIASLPLGILDLFTGSEEANTGHYNTLLRLTRLRSIPKLFRLSRIAKMFKHYQKSSMIESVQAMFNLSYAFMRLVTSLLMIVVTVHLFACFWYLVAKIEDFGPDTWVSRYGYMECEVFTCYLTSLYWVLTTLTSIGYGDISPYTNLEIVFGLVWMVCSLYFISFSISNMSNLAKDSDIKRRALSRKVGIMQNYSEKYKLNKELSIKIKKHLLLSSNDSSFTISEKAMLLEEFPLQLKIELAENMYKQSMQQLELFKLSNNKIFIASIFPLLQPRLVTEEEIIYNENDSNKEIYFIIRGKVKFIVEEGLSYAVKKTGEHFGEVEVVKEVEREHTVLGGSYTQILEMHSEVISKLQEEFVFEWKKLEVQAIEEDKKLKRAKMDMKTAMKAKEDFLDNSY